MLSRYRQRQRPRGAPKAYTSTDLLRTPSASSCAHASAMSASLQESHFFLSVSTNCHSASNLLKVSVMFLEGLLQASFTLNLCGVAACKITHKNVSQATSLGATSGGMWVMVPSEFVSMRDEAMLRARPKSAQHTHCKMMLCAAFQTETTHIHHHTTTTACLQ